MNLIFINSLPTSVIFGKKIDAWWFHKNGFNVEFWDTSPIYFDQDELERYYGGNKKYKYIGPNHRTIFNEKNLFNSIDALEKNTPIYYLSRNIFQTVKDKNVIRYIQKRNLPLFFKQFESQKKPESLLGSSLFFLKLLKRKIHNRDIHPNYYFGCGEYSRLLVKRQFPNTNFISIPSPKIQWTKLNNILKYKYIVFVDETLEYAPDAKMFNYEICTDLEGYYMRMTKLFENIERWTGMPIVIAASGKYTYNNNRFKRKIIYAKTFSLIEHSSLIIGHTSSAIDHNIKCNKPMIFIDDKSFTSRKRDSFKQMIILADNTPIFSDQVVKNDIDEVMNKNRKTLQSLRKIYYRESGLKECYKEIMRDCFINAYDEI